MADGEPMWPSKGVHVYPFFVGFVLGSGSYLRDPWNILDAVIVAISVLSLLLGDNDALSMLLLERAALVYRFVGLRHRDTHCDEDRPANKYQMPTSP